MLRTLGYGIGLLPTPRPSADAPCLTAAREANRRLLDTSSSIVRGLRDGSDAEMALLERKLREMSKG